MRAVASTAFAFWLLLLCSARVWARQEVESTTTAPVFEFHSGFWVNLHHFLYLQGRMLRAAMEGGAQAEPEIPPRYKALASTDGMTEEQRHAWQSAVEVYARSWSSRDLLLNNQMVLINDRLAELEDCPDLEGRSAAECTSGIAKDLLAAVDEAAPIYRKHWWTEQDRVNRAWIAAMVPQVRSMGGNLAAQLAQTYEGKWPARIHVDVVYYAGPQGAYTSLAPMHLTIANSDSRNQGLTGFETLFYEASHVLGIGVQESIDRECRRLQKPIPRDLWNALLLYTSAERLGRASRAQSKTSAASKRSSPPTGTVLHDRGWGYYEPLIELYWQPYLDGQTDLDAAVARLINNI